jgi:pullulanase/glycogen debranching enzyme
MASATHVDGFRFDLASILSRDQQGRPMASPPILWDIESDPVLANEDRSTTSASKRAGPMRGGRPGRRSTRRARQFTAGQLLLNRHVVFANGWAR